MTITERLAYEGLKLAKIDTPNNLLIVMLYNYIHKLVLKAVTDKRLSDDSLRILWIAYYHHFDYASECPPLSASKPLDTWVCYEYLPSLSSDRVKKSLDELQKYGYIIYTSEEDKFGKRYSITFQVKFSADEIHKITDIFDRGDFERLGLEKAVASKTK